MTCGEVVATGRYPYTNRLGKLTRRDHEIVQESLRRVHGEELEDQDFSAISDGQRQRIMLARAICQQPQMIILDEPTAFLDIRHKIELLDILREMAQEKGITVIMSLHEIDLATKISDYVCCVKGEVISKCGPPDEIFDDQTINSLYEAVSYTHLIWLMRILEIYGAPIYNSVVLNYRNTFEDINQCSEEGKPYVQRAYQLGLILSLIHI